MRKGFLALCLAITTLALPATALADPTSITLTSSAATIVYGDQVTVSGHVEPAASGESVRIQDDTGTVLDTVTTDSAGAFESALALERTTELLAVAGATESAPVTVSVRAVVRVHLPPVRLFDTVVVRGSIAPAVPGGSATVSLVAGGRAVSTRQARIGAAGGFAARFRVERPGAYRARASFADADHLGGRDADGPRSTPLPSLRVGSTGAFVRALERRLVELHYRLTGVNGSFDLRTGDAVLAFHKVQRMARVSTVDSETWRALADPKVPRPRSTRDGFHIEVDQTRQVLYTVQDGTITDIFHVSTGKPSTPTRDGSFRVIRKIAGFSPNQLYYPSYFDGDRALHGWTDVPTYPASHGCVRIPYWNARFIYGLASLGTPVIVYHA